MLDPTLTSNKNHYKTYKKLYGTETSSSFFTDKQAIYKENEETVVLAVESNLYVCGSPIFPDTHPLSELSRVVLS